MKKRIGRPTASVTACSFFFIPPFVRPIRRPRPLAPPITSTAGSTSSARSTTSPPHPTLAIQWSLRARRRRLALRPLPGLRRFRSGALGSRERLFCGTKLTFVSRERTAGASLGYIPPRTSIVVSQGSDQPKLLKWRIPGPTVKDDRFCPSAVLWRMPAQTCALLVLLVERLRYAVQNRFSCPRRVARNRTGH